jgi:hypothetical protein
MVDIFVADLAHRDVSAVIRYGPPTKWAVNQKFDLGTTDLTAGGAEEHRGD